MPKNTCFLQEKQLHMVLRCPYGPTQSLCSSSRFSNFKTPLMLLSFHVPSHILFECDICGKYLIIFSVHKRFRPLNGRCRNLRYETQNSFFIIEFRHFKRSTWIYKISRYFSIHAYFSNELICILNDKSKIFEMNIISSFTQMSET